MPADTLDKPIDAGFGIYVHWPFCAAKCPYCDFNSHVSREIDQPRYLKALISELKFMASLAPGRTVNSVFFGGGTPSLMDPEVVAGVLDAVAENWPMAPNVEVTLEANPTSVEADRFIGYRAAGVNRVSLGIQALDDKDLRFLGRLHTVSEALGALKIAHSAFDRVSFDLIYARPRQTAAAWASELDEACQMAGDHLSLYQLTIEPDTPFAALHARGKLPVPGEDLGRDLYDATLEVTARHGMPAYEISNHARPGSECRHNLTYWGCGEWAGIGPGAHSRLDILGERTAISTIRSPETWLAAVESSNAGVAERLALSPIEITDEFLVMGLRLASGIDPARYEALAGRHFVPDRVQDLVGYGLIEELANGRLRATPSGFAVLNAVVADLAA